MDLIPLSWNLLLQRMRDGERVELELHEIDALFKEVKQTAPEYWKSGPKTESIKKLYDVLSKSEEIW